jgi:hypothetical protein
MNTHWFRHLGLVAGGITGAAVGCSGVPGAGDPAAGESIATSQQAAMRGKPRWTLWSDADFETWSMVSWTFFGISPLDGPDEGSAATHRKS